MISSLQETEKKYFYLNQQGYQSILIIILFRQTSILYWLFKRKKIFEAFLSKIILLLLLFWALGLRLRFNINLFCKII